MDQAYYTLKILNVLLFDGMQQTGHTSQLEPNFDSNDIPPLHNNFKRRTEPRIYIHENIDHVQSSDVISPFVDAPYQFEDDIELSGKLSRGLSSRHVQLIAIGGAIGTGVFMWLGTILSDCGPASLLIAYIFMSSVVYFVMQMLVEMTTFLPLPGNGAQSFVIDYLSDSFGFAVGYNYWLLLGISVAAELTAASIVIQYWNREINVAAWISIILGLVVLLNLVNVKHFGEAEFWFASMKLILLSILIILGIVLFFGGGPHHDKLGFRYWSNGRAFNQHNASGSTGKFFSVWSAIVKLGFSFLCSPELVAAAGGECQKPRLSLPKAARRFIWRLVFFYVFCSLVMGIVVNSDVLRALEVSHDVYISPFVISIQSAGIHALDHIINAAILVTTASASNSFLYSGSRTIYSIACRGQAPKFLTKVNRLGIPYFAVFLTSMLGLLAYLNCATLAARVFAWLGRYCTISGYLSWILVSCAYLRWRKAIIAQDIQSRVTYTSRFQPFGAYYVIFMLTIVSITNGYAIFINFSVGLMIACYIVFPLFAIAFFAHKLYEIRYYGKTPWLRPLVSIDLTTGLDLVEYEDRNEFEPVPRNWWQKFVSNII